MTSGHAFHQGEAGQDSLAMIQACLNCKRSDCNGEPCLLLQDIRRREREQEQRRPRKKPARNRKPYMAEAERMYTQGATLKEIAETLDKNPSTIRTWFRRWTKGREVGGDADESEGT